MYTNTIQVEAINQEIEKILIEEGFDLTDEKTIRLANRLSTQRNKDKENVVQNGVFDEIVEDLTTGIAIIKDKKFIYANTFFSSLTGYSSAELNNLSKGLLIIHPQDQRGLEIAFKRLYGRTQDKLDIVHRIITKTGSVNWVRSQFIAIIDDQDELEKIIVSSLDLSLLNETQQKSEELGIVYESLIDNSSEGLEIIELAFDDKLEGNKLITRNPVMRNILIDDYCLYLKPEDFEGIMPKVQSDGLSTHNVLKESLARVVKNRYASGEFDFIIKNEIRRINYEVQLLKVNEKFLLIRHFRDVSELQKKELQLKVNEKKLRGIIEALPGGITMIDKNGKHIFASPQTNEILGYPEEKDFTGTRVIDFFDKKEHKELLRFILNSQDYESKFLRLNAVKGDGTIFPMECHVKKIINEETGELEIITYINDYTEKLTSENDIKERKAIYESLIEYSFSGIDISEVEIDRKHFTIEKANVLISNDIMNEIFGIREGELSKEQIKNQLDILFNNNEEEQRQKLEMLLKQKYIKSPFSIESPDGLRRFNLIFRLVDVNNKMFIIRIVDDITEQFEQDSIISNQLETLQERQSELEKYIESNLQLENFAYIASHDLKAPLRTVLSFSQLIKRSSYDKLESRDKEFLDIVIKSTNNMMLLIEDLLTFSRVNTKKVQIEELDINDLKETILLDLTTSIIQSEAELVWNFENERILADKVKLVQLFENLIRNAMKFTRLNEKPLIHITYNADNNYHYFSIRDNGIGISQDHFKKIFGIFEKLHSKDTYEGTGLGLSICSKIVEQHHGKIWVESELGNGSDFKFTISKSLLNDGETTDFTSI